ncbi:carboxymuconolactone decarboxylase family protein [Flavobacterium soyangense]|uniref:Carboxymuconolactone decarboxylase family protein n=1 Tax=Flavobacterium soyangense TaxID=2023265 RepID=A0A930XWT7_9FLAO|nr:carboxymuconolactone decarboxylase family protein [Flavobacterium soyangense]MBF2709532.1 carboxymuconolactone decarboxylase family protein [Flavobacterium soyangense]
MEKFTVPTRENVSENNQAIFDNLQKAVGFVPNMFAFFAHSPSALGDYLTLQNRKTSLSNKEKEVINLVVSQINGCNYCKAAHTTIGKMVGFTEEQTLEIRRANISFNPKLNALVKFAKEIVETKGEVSAETKTGFFNEGYTTENLVDVVMMVGDKIITNYLFALAKVPIDFPEPQAI